jgi:hypothetical protein
VVLDAIGMLEAGEEPNFFEDVLPLLQALLPVVGHLLDGHHLTGDVVSGIVDGTETAVSYLPQVIEYFVRILPLEQLRHLWVLQGARPGSNRHLGRLKMDLLVLNFLQMGAIGG